MKPSADHVRKILQYDADTGIFVWKISPSRNTPAGSVAGADCDGYRLIRVLGGRYKAHQLAWLTMTNDWPTKQIDHKDGDKGNNRWANLRLATTSQNKANIGRRSDNKSGYKGVCWYPQTKKWVSQIRFQGKNKNLGYYHDPAEAHAAYCAAADRLFGEFARHG